VQVSDSAPESALLAEALAKALGKSPEQALVSCRKDIAKKVSASLSAAGFLTQTEDKALGIFPRRSWRLTEASPQAALREKLAAALLRHGEAEPRIAALIGLLHSIKVEHKIFPDADRKELRARAKIISQNNWAEAAVKDTINATYASMTAAVLVATTAASV
jgi:Golgi phosphoprotein 3 (GPP34)